MIVLLCLAAALTATELRPAIPMMVTEPGPGVPAGALGDAGRIPARSPQLGSEPAWAGLERLTPAERANARLHLEPSPAASPAAREEVRAIEDLWNSGNPAAALERFHNVGEYTDPASIFVGINWNIPIRTTFEPDWGDDVRVGMRDSFYRTAFDLNNETGYLLVGALRIEGVLSFMNMNRSTDHGQTWEETFNGWFNWYPADLAGVGNGPYFYICYPSYDQTMATAIRFSAYDGHWVPYASGCWFDTAFATSAPAESITEVTMCSADDFSPNEKMYAFARTNQRNLLLSIVLDSTGQPWYPYPTGVNWCDGMIDCTINPFRHQHNWLFASWMFRPTPDSQFVAVGFLDDTLLAFHAYYIGNLPISAYGYGSTGIAGYSDTILVTYTHRNFGTEGSFYTRYLWSDQAGDGWYWGVVPDTIGNREHPDVTGRHGGGFAVVHREYGEDSGRFVSFTHSDYEALQWTLSDTVSDYEPSWVEKPRVEWIAPESYGVVYTKSLGDMFGSLWFDRSGYGAIAEQKTTVSNPFGLVALPRPGGVCLAFSNPQAGDVRLRIYDANGRLMHNESRRLGAGYQSIRYTGATNGLYFARLDIGKQASTAKFAIVQ